MASFGDAPSGLARLRARAAVSFLLLLFLIGGSFARLFIFGSLRRAAVGALLVFVHVIVFRRCFSQRAGSFVAVPRPLLFAGRVARCVLELQLRARARMVHGEVRRGGVSPPWGTTQTY